MLTAAHVVNHGSVLLKTHDGQSLKAWVVRISHQQDVALLSVGKSSSPRPCLALSLEPQTPGSDIYAIGSPASEELAFSLSRGIVSGVRELDNVALLQTDASLSPGNSGGAMIDKNARVVGIVSRKIAGRAVEGLGFAIPIEAGLTALKLLAGTATSAELLVRTKDARSVAATKELVDLPDPVPALDPVGDRHRLEDADLERRERERDDKTPGYLPFLRWGGLSAAILGSYLVYESSNANTGKLTRSDYESIRTRNDLGWVALGVGAASFVASFVLKPRLAPSKLPRATAVSVLAGSGGVRLRVSF